MDLGEMGIGAGLLALLGYTFVSGGSSTLSEGLSSGQHIKSLRDQMALSEVKADFAAERYADGCIVHAKRAQVQRPEHTAIGGVTLEYLSIRGGEPPMDWRTGMPYSAGAVLCDVYGNTGIVQPDGTVADTAYTGDMAMVREYVSKYFGMW